MAIGIQVPDDIVAPDHEHRGAASLQHIFERLKGERPGVEESSPELGIQALIAKFVDGRANLLGSDVSLVGRSDKDCAFHS
jgi:hypothetical protein